MKTFWIISPLISNFNCNDEPFLHLFSLSLHPCL
ncbi:hypothetical protein X975_25076, partial [Stegodyphus mimosarum]